MSWESVKTRLSEVALIQRKDLTSNAKKIAKYFSSQCSDIFSYAYSDFRPSVFTYVRWMVPSAMFKTACTGRRWSMYVRMLLLNLVFELYLKIII